MKEPTVMPLSNSFRRISIIHYQLSIVPAIHYQLYILYRIFFISNAFPANASFTNAPQYGVGV